MMVGASFDTSELCELCWAQQAGELSPEEAERLDTLVTSNPAACDYYIRYTGLCANLEWMATSVDKFSGEDVISNLAKKPPPQISAPPLGFLGSAYHGTVGFFSQEIPFACLVTTIIMGVAGVIGLNTTKEHYTQLPWKSVTSAERSFSDAVPAEKARVAAAKEEKMQWVGQITGKVDCVWADDSTAPAWHKFGMNDKFELKSGLVEITYYSGAKVILQGPCTYAVDSAAGGYLSLGKLTARVEKKGTGGAGRGTGEDAVASGEWLVASESTEFRNPEIPKSRNSSSLATRHSPLATSSSPPPLAPSPSSLFAVRTPTATVTDLGTEFGVEVNGRGFTDAHVFRGRISLIAMTADGDRLGQEMLLGENESAGVERPEDGDVPVVIRRSGDEKIERFVRVEQLPKYVEELRLKPFRRWQAFSSELRKREDLVAYYDFQQAPGKPGVLPNVAEHRDGAATDGVVEYATWSDGRMAGKHALRFVVPDSGVKIHIPGKFESLTLAAWVNVEYIVSIQYASILTADGWNRPGQIHWQLLNGNMCSVNVHPASGDPRPYINHDSDECIRMRDIGRWRHLAMAYDGSAGELAFYADGRLVSKKTIADRFPLVIGDAMIGNVVGYPREGHELPGKIDELAVFNRAMNGEEIKWLCEAKKAKTTKFNLIHKADD